MRSAVAAMGTEAARDAEGTVPNPFYPDKPLSGDEGPGLFRGRESTVREIEEILADSNRAVSLQLLAPRRAGKTSLLKMLPDMAPDSIFVFFDLQAHPVSTVESFWNKLSKEAVVQAKLTRRVALPPLPPNLPPMEAGAAWLELLDTLPDRRKVLIAIDEFERLEDLFPGSRREFLQLMGLFRATIQHRRNVRLLVSGAAPFEELDGVWDDHFISVRRVKLPFLDEPTSIGLLAAGAIGAEVARAVYRRTGGQPYLLQIFGHLLITRLNETKRQTCIAADVEAVESAAIEWAQAYFGDTYRHAPPGAQQALIALAQGEAINPDAATRRWLAYRQLLTVDGGLAVPLFGAWMHHHGWVPA